MGFKSRNFSRMKKIKNFEKMFRGSGKSKFAIFVAFIFIIGMLFKTLKALFN